MTKAERWAKERELKKNVKMTQHKMEVDELLEDLKTNLDKGLTSDEVKQRQAEDGKNELTPPPTVPAWRKFAAELFGFFSLLLWAGAILCFVAYGVREEIDNLILGIVLCFVVVVTACFSFFQNSKSENLMKSFSGFLPPQINVLRDGETKGIEAKELVKGDIVLIEAGDLIPADLRIIECSDNMAVDNAALTGESEPQRRKPACTHDDPLETQNLCFFGTQVPEGSCTAVVVATGDHTVMGRIASLAMSTKNKDTPISIEIHHFIHIVSAIAIILGVTFFIIGIVLKTDLVTNFVFMIGIIVANVPEGLLATVTVSLTLTARRMAKKMVLVKNLEGVETLGSTSCICSDKTGTLTQNIMTVAQIVYGGADTFNIEDCESSFTRGNKTYDENSPCFKALQRCATLCNISYFKPESKIDSEGNPAPFFIDVVQGDGTVLTKVNWTPVGNASEGAMIKFCHPFRDIEEYRQRNPAVFTIPFNSKNKYQVHVHTQEQYQRTPDSWDPSDNDGPRVVLMKGAPERVLQRCDKALLNGEIVNMTPELAQKINDLQIKLSKNGLRVLGFAEKELPVSEYGPDYDFNDGSEEGYNTPNFPLGEFYRQEEMESIEKEGGVPQDINIHPKSLEGLVYIGMMALIDPPRPAVPGAVMKCKTAGIKVIMVTGDHPVTAAAIAHKVGILWSKTRKQMEEENQRYQREVGDAGYQDPDDAEAIVIPGHEISVDMDVDHWDEILEHPQIVFARTSPQQKLLIVENCQRIGHIVAVTGDGVNDSPALKKADIGVAMGITGSEVSKTAADMILLDDNFASIVAGVEEGRLIFDNLKKSIAYTLSSNIPEISPFLCFITLQTPLPLSTVLILAIDLGTDMVPAISMAYEESEADIMMRPPRNSHVDRLVTKKLVFFAYLQIGIIQAAAGFYTWLIVLNDYGYPPNILRGLGAGDYWGKQNLYCQYSGGQYVSLNGTIDESRNPEIDAPHPSFPFWDRGDGGYIKDCQFPLKNYKGGSDSPGKTWDITDASTYVNKATKSFNMVSAEAQYALAAHNYYPYLPWKAQNSPFWRNEWLAYPVDKDDQFYAPGLGDSKPIIHFNYQPAGIWSLCAADPDLSEKVDTSPLGAQAAIDKVKQTDLSSAPNCDAGTTLRSVKYRDAVFCNGESTSAECTPYLSWNDNSFVCDSCEAGCRFSTLDGDDSNNELCSDISNRMSQKEALHHAQGAFFVTIVIVQWADLLICKTRWLSIRQQGMRNSTLNFGLFFETLLAAWLCYFPYINLGLGTRNIRFTHWMPGIPFSIIIFCYDETRKYLMRTTSPEKVDKATGQVRRYAGWLERNTYY